MQLTGAEIIIRILEEQGVDTVFGYPGGTAITVYDALYNNGGKIRHVLTSHEQGAAHAADGYARATGRPGVCLVTSGPGATNLVTGIANAYMDSIPMVAITVNVATRSLGKDSFQEVDIAGVTMPITKHNFIIKDVNMLAGTLRRAFSIAASGRRGPVLVDIPKDVTKAFAEYEPEQPVDVHAAEPCPEELERAASLLRKAKRPLLLIGGGAAAAQAQEEVMELLELTGMPAADTLMGKGVCPGTSGNYIGMAGMYGTKAADTAVNEADVLLAVGMRFSERVTRNSPQFASQAAIIHIDIDRAETNKNVMAEVSLTGDAKEILGGLNRVLGKYKVTAKRERSEWLERLKKLNGIKNDDAGNTKRGTKKLTGPAAVRTVYEAAGGDVLVATEVGLNQMWAAAYFNYTRPGQLITSGGLGTMGFGLGAAIGAAVGCPDRKVVNFAGDGCFRMNMNELLTAVRLRLPIIEIIFDNRSLGMVHQMQKFFYDAHYSQTEFTDDVDYAAIASAMGAASARVGTVSGLYEAVVRALNNDGPTVIVCEISPDETFDFAR